MHHDDPSVTTTYQSWETEFLVALREGFRHDLHAAREAKQPQKVDFCVDRIALVERILLERGSAEP
jgi:hypothetical protein